MHAHNDCNCSLIHRYLHCQLNPVHSWAMTMVLSLVFWSFLCVLNHSKWISRFKTVVSYADQNTRERWGKQFQCIAVMNRKQVFIEVINQRTKVSSATTKVYSIVLNRRVTYRRHEYMLTLYNVELKNAPDISKKFATHVSRKDRWRSEFHIISDVFRVGNVCYWEPWQYL